MTAELVGLGSKIQFPDKCSSKYTGVKGIAPILKEKCLGGYFF